MSPEETELSELARRLRGRWKLILAPAAIAAAAVLAAFALLVPPRYEATTLLAVHPKLRGDRPYDRSVRIQRALIESDAVVRRAAEALATAGAAAETAEPTVGRELSTRIVNMKDGAGMSPVLALTARRDTPARAAATADAWAQAAIAESRTMFTRGAPGEQAWLDGMAVKIEEARRRLSGLEEDRRQILAGGGPAADPRVLDRDIELAQGRLDQLEAQVERRTVATAFKRRQPLTVMAAAVPPQAPVPRRLPTKVATAAFLGGMLGLMVALGRRGEAR